jgi:hypothetical protein
LIAHPFPFPYGRIPEKTKGDLDFYESELYYVGKNFPRKAYIGWEKPTLDRREGLNRERG